MGLIGYLHFQDNSGKTKIFGKPYKGNWWLETEKTFSPLNNLLSIILYSDATTFDGFGKTSGHPVFLTFGNLPNQAQNMVEVKVLLGFLLKVQDTGIKTSEYFVNYNVKYITNVLILCFNLYWKN